MVRDKSPYTATQETFPVRCCPQKRNSIAICSPSGAAFFVPPPESSLQKYMDLFMSRFLHITKSVVAYFLPAVIRSTFFECSNQATS